MGGQEWGLLLKTPGAWGRTEAPRGRLLEHGRLRNDGPPPAVPRGMLDTLRMLIADSLPTVTELDPPIHEADIRVAACALLLEIAHADRRLSRDERAVILRSLTTYFGVDDRGALELIAEAERQWSERVDRSAFTNQLLAEYDEDQRHVLSDLLWDVAGADGWLGDHETLLTTQLSALLGVPARRVERDRPPAPPLDA